MFFLSKAGGDTTEGQGGTPAFVGFNAGNGTRSYEYKPYSQTTFIRDLPGTGNANGFPGRHIFRIDEKILPGVCIRDLSQYNFNLNYNLSSPIERMDCYIHFSFYVKTIWPIQYPALNQC